MFIFHLRNFRKRKNYFYPFAGTPQIIKSSFFHLRDFRKR